jgi:hypothetical protein
MLDGIESSNIIVGAYADRDGGVCPMLAAHRRGGRTNLVSFARAWDRYTRAGKRSRTATKREVHTLKTMLQASLVRDDSVRDELSEAVAELQAIQARRAEEARHAADTPAEPAAADEAASVPLGTANGHERRDTGERDRSDELERHHGWAWTKVFRRYDEYEEALERVERAEREAERREVERRDLEPV